MMNFSFTLETILPAVQHRLERVQTCFFRNLYYIRELLVFSHFERFFL